MERYKLEEKPICKEDLIASIGRKRGCVRSRGDVDMHKASVILINEIRGKILGAITFEMPENIEKENAHFAEIEAKKIAAVKRRSQHEVGDEKIKDSWGVTSNGTKSYWFGSQRRPQEGQTTGYCQSLAAVRDYSFQ